MSLATARRDIEKRLEDNWALTRIVFDNVPLVGGEQKTDETWIRCQVFEEDATRLNIGNPGCHRVSGLIILSVMVPEKTGTQTARDYADQLALIFRDKQFSGITCEEARPRNVGGSLKSGWYQYDISIPFYWDGSYDVS